MWRAKDFNILDPPQITNEMWIGDCGQLISVLLTGI